MNNLTPGHLPCSSPVVVSSVEINARASQQKWQHFRFVQLHRHHQGASLPSVPHVWINLGVGQKYAQAIWYVVLHGKHQSCQIVIIFDVRVRPLVCQQQGDAVKRVVDESELEGGAVKFVNPVDASQVLASKQHAKSFYIVAMQSVVEGGGPVAVQVDVHVGLLQEQLAHLVVVLRHGDHQTGEASAAHSAVHLHPGQEGSPCTLNVAIAAMLQKFCSTFDSILDGVRHSEIIKM